MYMLPCADPCTHARTPARPPARPPAHYSRTCCLHCRLHNEIAAKKFEIMMRQQHNFNTFDGDAEVCKSTLDLRVEGIFRHIKFSKVRHHNFDFNFK
jgi:hypothetical protein